MMLTFLATVALSHVLLTPVLTPGQLADNPATGKPYTRVEVCNKKWGHDARFVTPTMKKVVLIIYGFRWETPAELAALESTFEFDHKKPRSEGGADRIANIQPQLWVEAYQKDGVERAAHNAVCAGRMSLQVAQDAFGGDWRDVMQHATPKKRGRR